MRVLSIAAVALLCSRVAFGSSVRGLREVNDDELCSPTVQRDFTCAWSWMKRLQTEVPTAVCNVAKMVQDLNTKRAELHYEVDEFVGQFSDGASGILSSCEITNLKGLKTAESSVKTAMFEVLDMHDVGHIKYGTEHNSPKETAGNLSSEDLDKKDMQLSPKNGKDGNNGGKADKGSAQLAMRFIQIGKQAMTQRHRLMHHDDGHEKKEMKSGDNSLQDDDNGAHPGQKSPKKTDHAGNMSTTHEKPAEKMSPIVKMLMKPIEDEVRLINQVLSSTRSNALKKVEEMEVHGREVVADAAARAYQATASATDSAKFYVASEMDRALTTVGRAAESMRVVLEEHAEAIGDDITSMRRQMDALLDDTIKRANQPRGLLELLHEKTRGLKSRIHQLEYEGHNDRLGGLVNPIVIDLKNMRDSITSHDENMKDIQKEENDPQASPICLRKLWLFLENAAGGGLKKRIEADDHYLALVGTPEVGSGPRTGLLDKTIAFLNPSDAPSEEGTKHDKKIFDKINKKNLNVIDLIVHYVEDIQLRSEKYVHSTLPELCEQIEEVITAILEAFEGDMNKLRADIERVHKEIEEKIHKLGADMQDAVDQARHDAEDKLKAKRKEADGIVIGQGQKSRNHFKVAGQTFLDRIQIIKSMIAGNVANTEKWVKETFDEKNPYTVHMEDAVVKGSNAVQTMNSMGINSIRKVVTESAFLSERQTSHVSVDASVAAMVGHVSDKFRNLVKEFGARIEGKLVAHYQGDALNKMKALRGAVVDRIERAIIPESGASSPISKELDVLWKDVSTFSKRVDELTLALTQVLTATGVCAGGDEKPPISFGDICTVAM